MQYTVAEYTVKQAKLKAVQRALGEFVAQVRQHEPRTLYLVFSDDTKCTFVHVMAFENGAAERKHSQSRYVERFARTVSPHCVGKPVFSEMNLSTASRKQWMLAEPVRKRGTRRVLRQEKRRVPSFRFQ
jgi:quinol monooxygenase YgiN